METTKMYVTPIKKLNEVPAAIADIPNSHQIQGLKLSGKTMVWS
jgi:hypothetical protein